jgi:hypothetical protein
MKTPLTALILLATLALTACALAPQSNASLMTDQTGGGSTGPSMPGSGPAAPGKAAQPSPVDPSVPSVSQRLVIKNASLEIVVESPTQALQTISEMAQQMNGFVVSSSSFKTTNSSGSEVPQAKITVRVPADKLDEALAKIHSLVKNADMDIRNENVTGQDVTEDYTDLNSRLTNLQAAEKQLQAILENATKTEDVLSVFQQLTSIRQDIEVTQGKIKFYEQSAALSAIDVSILAEASVAPIVIGGWQPLGIARDALQALIAIGQFLVGAVIWIVIVLVPIGLLFYFPIRFLRRWMLRNRKQHTPVSPAAPLAG